MVERDILLEIAEIEKDLVLLEDMGIEDIEVEAEAEVDIEVEGDIIDMIVNMIVVVKVIEVDIVEVEIINIE